MAQSKAVEREGQAAVIAAISESTPLLAESEPIDPSSLVRDGDAGGDAEDEEDVPFPKSQIYLLCLTRVVDPIAFFSIFPYVNSMIEEVGGIEHEDVGFYSGLIESLFSLTQMCVMIFWGKAADRWGRKPSLVFSLLGISVAITLFGMSQSILQMVVARCFAGVFAGTVLTVRTMLSENSTKHTQAKVFSYFAFAGNLGVFIGPLIGGALERPAEKYPFVFGKIQFFHKYPYALPGMATSAIALSAALSTALFVKETLPSHHSSNKKAITEPRQSTWELLSQPGVARVILISNYIMLLAFTFTAVNPVFLHTHVSFGGLGFTPALISGAISLAGASQAIWLLVIFPRLHKRVGTGAVMRLAAAAWPVFFAAHPFFNFLLKKGMTGAFWGIAPPFLAVGSGIAMAFTASQLAINDIAPSPSSVGALNAIALAVSSGLRAVAPALATSVYAIGVKYQILDGQLFWLCNVVLAIGFIGVVRLLPAKAGGLERVGGSGRGV